MKLNFIIKVTDTGITFDETPAGEGEREPHPEFKVFPRALGGDSIDI